MRGTRTYTIEEAAEFLGVSRGAAYQAARTGQLPTVKIGRRLLVPMAALERLLDPDQQAEMERLRGQATMWADEAARRGALVAMMESTLRHVLSEGNLGEQMARGVRDVLQLVDGQAGKP